MVDIVPLTEFFSDGLIKLAAAIAILLLGILFARFFSKVTKKVLEELGVNELFKNELGVKLSIADFISRFIVFAIYFTAIILALNQLGLTGTVFYGILAGILLLIIVLLVFAFKDFVPNLVAGIYIIQKKIIKKGENISITSVTGEIVEINLIETRVRTKEGDEVLVPNSILFKSELRKIKKEEEKKE